MDKDTFVSEVSSTVELFKVQYQISSLILESIGDKTGCYDNEGARFLTKELFKILNDIENYDLILADYYNESLLRKARLEIGKRTERDSDKTNLH